MLNILHTIETRGPGGAEILVLNIAKYLASRNCRNFGCFIKDGWIKDEFSQNHFKIFFHPLNTAIDIWFVFKLIRFIKQNRINLIHAHEFTMSFYASIISLITGIGAICTFHGKNYHSDKFRRRLIMTFIANASKIVAVSQDVKSLICNKAYVDDKKIVVIENGIIIPEESNEGSLKKELNLSDDCILIGSIGRLHKVKGHSYLVKAAVELVKKFNNIYFIIAGDGPEKESLKNEITESGLDKKFLLLGTRNDINNILSSIDIFVLPSLSEGTSLALLEAMSHGLPIIATKVGNNANLLRNKNSGILIKPQSSVEIADNLSFIINTKAYKNIFNNNIQFVRNYYSFDIMIEKYISLYL